MNIGVLGAGTWGISLARLLANKGYSVIVYSPIKEEIESLTNTKKHKYLDDVELPSNILYTSDIKEATTDKDIILVAVPSIYVRKTVSLFADSIKENQTIVTVSKGIESNTLLTMSQVIRDVFSKTNPNLNIKIVALSGPTHAEEVARDIPTAIVSSCEDKNTSEFVQNVFSTPTMRVYTNFDTEGVEICGAAKNIIALAAGIVAGLGYGDNTKAAIITRGMAEIQRLGKAMGCYDKTFYGLAGIGDLIVTCTSLHSRNYKCGLLLGKGKSLKEALDEVGMVVEGVNALPAIIQLSKKFQVEMPITYAVQSIIDDSNNFSMITGVLMERKQKTEIDEEELDKIVNDSLINSFSQTRRIITYGSFDLLHYGHINLLRRAKRIGDYLIVALSTDEFSSKCKNKKTFFDYEKRKSLIESIRYVDLVIPEENWEQKIKDIEEYNIDVLVMGNEWEGEFDYLEEKGVKVIYLPQTPEISSSQIREDLKKKKEEKA